ncbi:MAG: lipopolysaccharide heptosyltransferase I [Magnetococcales bacterium]|nr:lipopolysaccharide heptosyltransferase I [Magnetococcales bacterium]MBF0347713.1 lipopolysaccharide heptosyltransferase I [Magnetococcales bacterium]MBF0630618.1 lipopolysaccharide heptosyltransferase I [Magnetococcales bacterium]
MNLLIVKTSSLGDVVHTLPAVTDATDQHPECVVHWLVEEGFAEIPSWHRAVCRVIVLPWRRWRRQPFRAWSEGEPGRFFKQLRQDPYDVIIDAQGLLKSAIPARLARGPVWGFDPASAREPLASRCYHHCVPVPVNLHAIHRLRLLFAQTLNYPLPTHPPDHGLDSRLAPVRGKGDHLVFIHGTTWSSKHWPEHHWQQLAASLDNRYPIWLPWGNATEKKRAQAIAAAAPRSARVLEQTTLAELAHIIASARGVVTVDTGPSHLAAAFSTPALSLYGPTDPSLVGTQSHLHQHQRGTCPLAPCRQRICPLLRQPLPPPCMESITPLDVNHWLERLP